MSGGDGEQDVEVLLKIMEIYLSEPVRKARSFWRTLPDGLTFDQIREQYPPGSEGFEHIDTLMVFWETVGSMMKHGMLNEELAFDTFLDAPPWPKIETALRSLRQERDNAFEGENLELAYRRSLEWKSAHLQAEH